MGFWVLGAAASGDGGSGFAGGDTCNRKWPDGDTMRAMKIF